MQVLLSAKADINLPGENNMTSLWRATFNQSPEAVELLLQFKADTEMAATVSFSMSLFILLFRRLLA